MKTYQMAFVFVALLGTGAALGGCAVDAQDLDETSESDSELVTALDVPGTFDYGTWTDTYNSRVLAGTGVLTNAAQTPSSGSFACSGTTACPGSAGTWLYGQDTTRSRWVDFSANGSAVRWKLAETSDGRRVLARVLGTKLNRFGQRVSYGDLFLKR